jgi:hypothetical protein
MPRAEGVSDGSCKMSEIHEAGHIPAVCHANTQAVGIYCVCLSLSQPSFTCQAEQMVHPYNICTNQSKLPKAMAHKITENTINHYTAGRAMPLDDSNENK